MVTHQATTIEGSPAVGRALLGEAMLNVPTS